MLPLCLSDSQVQVTPTHLTSNLGELCTVHGVLVAIGRNYSDGRTCSVCAVFSSSPKYAKCASRLHKHTLFVTIVIVYEIQAIRFGRR